MMLRDCWTLFPLLAIVASVSADDARVEMFEREFDQQIVPLIKTHCLSCHDTETMEAELDLTAFRRLQEVTKSHAVWKKILEQVEAGEMQPAR